MPSRTSTPPTDAPMTMTSRFISVSLGPWRPTASRALLGQSSASVRRALASRPGAQATYDAPTMAHFTPIAATAAAVLIGIAASMLLILNGRIAGVSGIVGRTFRRAPGDRRWRLLFGAGLLAGGALMTWLQPGSIAVGPAGLGTAAIAGLL